MTTKEYLSSVFDLTGVNQQRRRILKLVGSSSLVALAGCSSSNSSDDDSGERENGEKDTDNSVDTTQTGAQTSSSDATGSAVEQVSKLTTDDPTRGFGREVAMSGDGSTVIIGGAFRSDTRVGTAYVFTPNGGSWRLQATLTVDSSTSFGRSVALSNDGSTAIIGAQNATSESTGAAYVFRRSGGSWRQQTTLTADTTQSFGEAVAMSGDGSTAVITDFVLSNRGGAQSGSAYVFTRSGDSWRQQTKLEPTDANARDGIGMSVAISSDGSTAIIGARDDDTSTATSSGAAYVFSQGGGGWDQPTKLAADDGDSDDQFGASVAMSSDGSTAIISARKDADPNGLEAGSAYVFRRAGSSWRQQAKLAAGDGDRGDHFGSSVAVAADGSTALIGAGDDNPTGNRAGSAYLFSRRDGTWRQQAKLTADDGEAEDFFGRSVAVSANASAAIVGAPGDEGQNIERAGSAYLFE